MSVGSEALEGRTFTLFLLAKKKNRFDFRTLHFFFRGPFSLICTYGIDAMLVRFVIELFEE